jgi:hypothetical protein
MEPKNQNSFDDLQRADVTIERNGIEKKFRVRELNGEEASKVLNTTNSKGKRDAEKARTLDARLISTSVVEITDSGERQITFNEAQGMGLALRRQLVRKALELNGLDDDGDDEKN